MHLRFTKPFIFICLSFLSFSAFSQYVGLDQQFKNYKIVNINTESILSEIQNSRSEVISISLLDYDLQLFTSNIISNNYKLKVQNANGQSFLETKKAIPMQGSTSTGGRVSLTFNDDFVHGFIIDKKETYFIEPLSNFENGKAKNLFVFYNIEDVIEGAPKMCGVTKMHERERELTRTVHASQRLTGQCFEVEWAIANDYLMLQSYGNVAAVENHAIGVANDVQTNYDDEFADEIQFIITEQFVSMCASCDPWTSSTDAGTLLSSFTSWGPSGFSFVHDVGSLWTDRNFNGGTIGIAWLGGICNNFRYNCLQDWSNNANLKRVMVAHEIGHNFDATHDGSGSPFIMAPAVNNTTSWSANSISEIQSFYGSIGCLSSCSTSSAPTADFDFTYIDQCVPGIVDFIDNSLGTVTAWSWSFPGGSPATSTQQNPSITYPLSGLYDVTLTAFNGGLSNTISMSQIIEILDYPISEFDFIVNGSEVEFINLSQHATSYIWDFGDGNTSSETNPIHTYIDDANYFVSLIAINSCGTQFFNFEVVIATPPIPDFSATPTVGCNPLIVNYTNESSSNVITLFWEFEGGSPATSTVQNPIVLYSDAGTFATKLTVTNPQGIVEKEIPGLITVHQTPSANFTSSSSGTVVNFTNTSIGGDSFMWDFGDGNGASVANPTHTYAASGTYIVTLEAVSNNCPNSTIVKDVIISLEPQAIFSVAGDTDGCTNFDVQFQDGSTNNPTTWAWTFEGGTPATSAAQNPMISYTTVGSFDVTLIATNSLGSDTVTLTDFINVNTIPTTDFTFTKTQTTVSFVNGSLNAISYLWNFGDGNTSTLESPIHDYSVEGTWTAILTSTNECGPFSKSHSFSTVLSPIAGFNYNNAPICGGESISFMDNSQNTVSSRLWTFEGGTPATSTEINPTVVYSAAGTFDVTLVVTNSEGNDQLVITDAVTVLSQPTASITSSQTGNIITYEYTGNPIDNITWLLPDGTTSIANPVNYTVNENGIYTASITVSNQCGVVNNTASETINVYPEAMFTISETNGCSDFITNFTTNSVIGASYNWTFEGGTPATSTDQNPTVTYSQRGSFDVTLTVTNSFGSDMMTLNDVINVEVEPTSVFTANYDGIVLTTINTSQFATSYLWDFGNGKTSTLQNPTHQYQNNGTYTVTLTTTNICGSTTSSSVVEVLILVPSINFITSVTEGCAPLEVLFTDMSGNDPTSFLWTFEGGTPATSTDQNPIVIYNLAGSFDVTVMMTNAAGNSELTETDLIIVKEGPTSDFGFNVSAGDVAFENMSSTNSETYSWDFGDGNTSIIESPSHSYAASGDFIVTLTTTNECGTNTVTKTVSIIISSIDNVDFINTLNIAPNPFNNNLLINAEFNKSTSGHIIVLDQVGRVILTSIFENKYNLKTSLELSSYPAGLYLVKIQSDGQFLTRKVIKN